MNKIIDDYYLTHHEDEDGAEWDIKVYFDYQPEEKAEYQEGMCVYPGCYELVAVQAVERNEPVYDVPTWFEFEDYTEQEAKDWESEILEAIHGPQDDDRGNEL